MRQSPNSEYKDSPGIWVIHIVEEIKLLPLYNLLYIYKNLLMYVGVIEDSPGNHQLVINKGVIRASGRVQTVNLVLV
jgi:hypothetical protein